MPTLPSPGGGIHELVLIQIFTTHNAKKTEMRTGFIFVEEHDM